MATVGPELPPHLLAKRKRQQEAEETDPQPLPRSRSSSHSSNASDNKRRRTIGPAPPPAPLSERPSSPPSEQALNDNSDSDPDDFGPSLPPSNDHKDAFHQPEISKTSTEVETSPKPQRREEWMLVPPSNSDWSSRIDPTKLRNRKFNTGKGSKAPPPKSGSGIDTIWTETPEQKRQRLQDEMMGVKKPAQLVNGDEDSSDRRGKGEAEVERRETERRIREFNEKNRGVGSLYEEHKKGVQKEKEDDPSKRAFDKEKDMSMGVKIGHAKRKEMLAKSADFGSRFAGGKYL
ncbi:MAG: hypothetical protein Q9166_002602 [cf. Caloplaca sp. 2 TL-2023]